MGTTLAFRFPLGRYHANPWDRAVNEGASEWPPSPWRILRALVATWYTRWPDLPDSQIDTLLDALSDPPSYKTPPIGTGHTRHYLPSLDHRKAETGNTDLTLDPFLTVGRDDELLVHWDADLNAELREVLAKLAELIPYLGRSESVCQARLLDADPLPDETWWRPDAAGGSARTRLLTTERPLDRMVIEATTAGIRKQRRTVPPGTRWVTYAHGQEPSRRGPAHRLQALPLPTAIRFAVIGPAPVQITQGVLVADEAHRVAARLLENARIPDWRRQEIMGTGGAASGHRHAHWIPVGDPTEAAPSVRSLIVWVPSGLGTDEVGAVLSLRSLSGKRGGEDGYEIRGFPKVQLLFQAAGQIEDVAPELCGQAARHWRSVTPYLPVRHRHSRRESLEEFLASDVTAELRYRDQPATGSVTVVEPSAGRVNQFRRYRMSERLRQSRAGIGLRLELDSPTGGPLLLGRLSHFGFGRFEPEPSP